VSSAAEISDVLVPSVAHAYAPATRPASIIASVPWPRAHSRPEVNASPAPLESTGRHEAHASTVPPSSATGSIAAYRSRAPPRSMK
jgi:hypothetical protein